MKPDEYFDRLESCIDEFIERLENVTIYEYKKSLEFRTNQFHLSFLDLPSLSKLPNSDSQKTYDSNKDGNVCPINIVL